MNNQEQDITHENAESALKMIESSQKDSITSFRPTLSVILIAAALFGFMTTSASYSSGNSLWSFITIVSTVLFISVMAYRYVSLRLDGKKLKLKPNGMKGGLFVSIELLILTVVAIGSMELYKSGEEWIPIIGGLINATIVVVSLYYFPTSDFSKITEVE